MYCPSSLEYNSEYDFRNSVYEKRIHYNDLRMNIGLNLYINNNILKTTNNNISIYYNDNCKITSYILKTKDDMNTYKLTKYKYNDSYEERERLNKIVSEFSKIDDIDLKYMNTYVNMNKIRINYEYCYKYNYLYI